MIQLFLSEFDFSNDVDDDSVKHRISLLEMLESVIWSLLSSSGRSEARLWLCNSLSSLNSISRHHKCLLFLNLLRSKPVKHGLAAQVLQMIIAKQPSKAGRILANKSYLVENFFKGHPRRILQWFSSFGVVGDFEHGKGAKALSQFAFINRDICWEELEWKGKHGQSPATVATKPHYFLDLDVQSTVENFLEYVPDFWSSREFSESLKDGEIFSIDTKFFIDLFIDLMYKEDMKEMWEVIEEFLMEESFSSLCQHLLIILDDGKLDVFLDLLCKYLSPRLNKLEVGRWSYWLEIILLHCKFDSLDQLFLLNAVVSNELQLLRLVREEEHLEQKEKIKDLVLQICITSSDANNLAPVIKECIKTKTIKSVIWLGLQSWALYYKMSEECQTSDSWESLFICNGIKFDKSTNYALLSLDESSGKSGSDMDKRVSHRIKRKRKEKRRKKRRKNTESDYHDDKLLDFDLSSHKSDWQSKTSGWTLSLDGFSTLWNPADLPKYLSKYCFSTWMKCILSKWMNVA